ncbi:MAG: hypothetical protein ACREJD_12430 [Phycisphaerales bacterium]
MRFAFIVTLALNCFLHAVALADDPEEDPKDDPPDITFSHLDKNDTLNGAQYDYSVKDRKWTIDIWNMKDISSTGQTPTITIKPGLDGDEIAFLRITVKKQSSVLHKVNVIITQANSSTRWANVSEVIQFSGTAHAVSNSDLCPVDLSIINVVNLTGKDSLNQSKCTINVSRVSNISTVLTTATAILDVRVWQKRGYIDADDGYDVGSISIAGNLRGRVYGGPQDDVTSYADPRPSMRQVKIGTIFAGGTIGDGTDRPEDPAVAGGPDHLEIGQSGFAFLVEATTIDSIEGDTLWLYADTQLNQTTSPSTTPRRISRLITSGTRSTSIASKAGIHGTVLADTIAPVTGFPALIQCDGDFTADMSLFDHNALDAGALAANGDGSPSVVIGRSFASGATIETDPLGLQGLVVINDQQVGGSWAGSAIVDGSTISHTGAEYLTASSTYGGGAVGLVPFHMYATDSVPPSVSPSVGSPETVFDSKLYDSALTGHDPAVELAFYGNVASESSTSSEFPVDIGLMVPDGTYTNYFLMNDRFDVVAANLSTGNRSRFVSIYGKSSAIYPPGVYMVKQNTSSGMSANRLVCDVAGTPEVESFVYYFTVVRDCNDNNTADASERIATGGSCNDCVPFSNGVLDSCETVAAYCYADLNLDENVDDADFVLFSVAYNLLYDCRGDFNGDGYTDDLDFQIFTVYYDHLLCDPLDVLNSMYCH